MMEFFACVETLFLSKMAALGGLSVYLLMFFFLALLDEKIFDLKQIFLAMKWGPLKLANRPV